MRSPGSKNKSLPADLSTLLSLKLTQGEDNARGLRFALVATQWYEPVLDNLLAGAVEALKECGADEQDLVVVRVPGAFELPFALDQLAASKRFHALIALGCVIRGSTPHFEYVAGECARGVREVGQKYGVPVSFGVLTCYSLEQAEERAAPGPENKGREAALAAVQMATLASKLRNV